MVKNLTSISLACLIVVFLIYLEQMHIKNSFLAFRDKLEQTITKLEDETAKADDIFAIQKIWVSHKQKLHLFIPHSEIKEIDLWVAEAIHYVNIENFNEAHVKLFVVNELAKQIPRHFIFSWGNIF